MIADHLDDCLPDIPDGQVHSATLLGLLRHWRSLRAAGGVPRRAAFDPMRIPALLPSVFLLGLEAESGRCRVRVIGTRLSAWIGREITGQYLDEAALPETLRQRLVARVVARMPFLLRDEAGDDELGAGYEVLGLPLADDRGHVSFMLGAMDFEEPVAGARARYGCEPIRR